LFGSFNCFPQRQNILYQIDLYLSNAFLKKIQKFEKKFFSAVLDALLKKSENFV